MDSGGWIAAQRYQAAVRRTPDSRVFAHTSPIYVRVDGTPHRCAEAAGAFVDEIENPVRLIRKNYRLCQGR